MGKYVKIVVFVPAEAANAVREAMGEAGAGRIGKYHFCSFSSRGEGRVLPAEGAKPMSGEVGVLSVVSEERIEVICERTLAKQVIAAMKAAHPYEEVAFDIYELLGEAEL